MIAMTESEYKALHIELWQWLYDNPGEGKGDWPRWIRNGGDIENAFILCFACAFANASSRGFYCRSCPLDQRIMKTCDVEESAYVKWIRSYRHESRREYAALIRDAWRDVP
jgi:hypothetical protein